jgi:type II secretory ATPase GspE/PulE/Tfp pilus assembly ATPase PilB-like protein
VEGITQGQVNPDAGFSFSKGIRSILRQDPDILMVGEIRDTETARTAIEAALTGHLVLSTLHTNDAPGAIMRLIDMGIEPFLINAAVTGVLAQRLARKICSDCKELVASQQTDRAVFDRIGIDLDRVYKGVGCSACLGTGYKGRTGIFELLSISPAMRSLIMQKPCLDQLYAQARIDGMSTLHQDGVQKIRDGIITPHELIRSIF